MRAISFFLLFVIGCTWNHIHAAATAPPNGFGIIGGRQVRITEAPYIALLRPRNFAPHCGACIIHEQFLLSAAHCVTKKYNSFSQSIVNLNPLEYIITVGTADVNGGVHYDIEKFVPHSSYFVSHPDYDLSVIKLMKRLIFSDSVALIPLAYGLPMQGEMLESVGFGRTEYGQLSNVLLKVQLPYVDSQTCKSVNTGFLVTPRIICAGGQPGKNICDGDSGGPLVHNGRLIGVVSTYYSINAEGCRLSGHPAGFAYIPSMMNFVNTVITAN